MDTSNPVIESHEAYFTDNLYTARKSIDWMRACSLDPTSALEAMLVEPLAALVEHPLLAQDIDAVRKIFGPGSVFLQLLAIQHSLGEAWNLNGQTFADIQTGLLLASPPSAVRGMDAMWASADPICCPQPSSQPSKLSSSRLTRIISPVPALFSTSATGTVQHNPWNSRDFIFAFDTRDRTSSWPDTYLGSTLGGTTSKKEPQPYVISGAKVQALVVGSVGPGMGRFFQLAHSQIHRELTAQIPYIAAAIRMASEISAYDGRRKLAFATWHSPLLANGSGSHSIIVADMLGGKEQYKCKQIMSDEMLRYDASNIDSSQELLSRGSAWVWRLN
ncbi:hypothetical protein B0H14DRAFT_2638935 [Mycena olivaceomarginata]|nr:hypothetical protein B0H14DRAFT_2638935 [Mycena olivaceomarginata]